ncbi:holin [Arcanobacterium haemolyticum]
MKRYTKTWALGALERAIKTTAQTMIALITTGAYIWEIEWSAVLGITATATLLSLLTSIADTDATDTAITKKGKHSYGRTGS